MRTISVLNIIGLVFIAFGAYLVLKQVAMLLRQLKWTESNWKLLLINVVGWLSLAFGLPLLIGRSLESAMLWVVIAIPIVVGASIGAIFPPFKH